MTTESKVNANAGVGARPKPVVRTPLRDLELELLGKLASHGEGGAGIPDLFEGMTPTWAANAATRLVERGEVTRDQDGRYVMTDAGQRALAGAKKPVASGSKPKAA